MQRLDEHRDNEHLSSGQRSEERVGSVDYDVWYCEACAEVLVLRYARWFSGYASCPGCRAHTKRSRSTTLQAATSVSGGSGPD